MAKYRLLSLDELKELEQEFIEYLILNGIAADDWSDIKDNQPEKSGEIVHLFSDVVFESIMRKTQFLERRDKKEIKILQCLTDKFVLVGLKAFKIHDADLTNSSYLKKAFSTPPDGVEVYTSTIAYENLREQEIFKMTEKGFTISNGDLFKTLCLVLPNS